MSNYTYLYLIHKTGTSIYKIGKSRNPKKRLYSLQSYSREPLKLITTRKYCTDMNYEKAMHDKFQRKRIKGEWFELSVEDVRYIKTLPRLSINMHPKIM